MVPVRKGQGDHSIPHDFRQRLTSTYQFHPQYHLHVRIAEVSVWLARTPGPLASFTRKRFLRSRLHRPPQRQTLARHRPENAHHERAHGSPRSQRIGSGHRRRRGHFRADARQVPAQGDGEKRHRAATGRRLRRGPRFHVPHHQRARGRDADVRTRHPRRGTEIHRLAQRAGEKRDPWKNLRSLRTPDQAAFHRKKSGHHRPDGVRAQALHHPQARPQPDPEKRNPVQLRRRARQQGQHLSRRRLPLRHQSVGAHDGI